LEKWLVVFPMLGNVEEASSLWPAAGLGYKAREGFHYSLVSGQGRLEACDTYRRLPACKTLKLV